MTKLTLIPPTSRRTLIRYVDFSRNPGGLLTLQAPMALDIRSPMDLVYECFVKLGLRYICVIKEGRYAGMASLPTDPFHHLALTAW